MPTARELLEQADALMRRNRERGHDPEPDIPELTDEVDVPEDAELARAAEAAAHRALEGHAGGGDAAGLGDEIPLEPHPDESEVSRWLETGLGAPSVTGPAPDSIVVVPHEAPHEPPPEPVSHVEPEAVPMPREAPPLATTAAALVAARVAGTLTGRPAEPPPESDPGFEAMLGMATGEPEFGPDLPQEVAPPEPAPPAHIFAEPPNVEVPDAGVEAPSPSHVERASELPPSTDATPGTGFAPDREQLEALAEEIRMQVLQRIDIFTDTGLQGELTARLQPVVDRASADLVATINREVGQLLRTYVAEAIEREIEKWRQANP